jgi:hypothetical protein
MNIRDNDTVHSNDSLIDSRHYYFNQPSTVVTNYLSRFRLERRTPLLTFDVDSDIVLLGE